MPTSPEALLHRFYPEMAFGGFTRVSATVEFFTRINALVKPTDRILDYGAGRGATIETGGNAFTQWMKDFKGRVAHVEGCDIDPAVLENPFLDGAAVIGPDGKLPYPDNSFDGVITSWVFEHIEHPGPFAAEVMRVLKPGGFLAAMTPNKRGYIALGSRLAGNAQHVDLLKRVQPDRNDFDVFPTFYRLNTRKDIQRAFTGAGDIAVYGTSSEPAYHFNNLLLYRLFRLIHAVTPDAFHTALLIFIRKA